MKKFARIFVALFALFLVAGEVSPMLAQPYRHRRHRRWHRHPPPPPHRRY
jgi:hypothetical protein